jgi:hypothetical protein
MIDKYRAPPTGELVYIGPKPHFDLASRKAYFAPDEAANFDLRNASIQFRMKACPEYVAPWMTKFASLGVHYMETDGEILDGIRDISERIEGGMFIHGSIRKSVRWSAAASAIRHLTIYDSEVFFDETSFPKLEFLNARKDKAGKLLNYVSSHQLKHLGISGFDRVVIEAAGAIESLQISGSTDTHVDFDEKPSVTDLWVHNLKSMEDVSFLARLPNLERLKIYYCGKIADFSPLLKLNALKDVDVVQQGQPKDMATFRALAESGVKISGL